MRVHCLACDDLKEENRKWKENAKTLATLIAEQGKTIDEIMAAVIILKDDGEFFKQDPRTLTAWERLIWVYNKYATRDDETSPAVALQKKEE